MFVLITTFLNSGIIRIILVPKKADLLALTQRYFSFKLILFVPDTFPTTVTTVCTVEEMRSLMCRLMKPQELSLGAYIRVLLWKNICAFYLWLPFSFILHSFEFPISLERITNREEIIIIRDARLLVDSSTNIHGQHTITQKVVSSVNEMNNGKAAATKV